MRKWAAKALTVALTAAGIQGVAVANPAWACGCGAYIPSSGGTASVSREQAVVRFDGTREDVVMRFSVRSDTTDAAWVMPVPTTAKATLASQDLFSQLDREREPLLKTRHYFWPHLSEDSGSTGAAGAAPPDRTGAAPGAAPPVNVLSDERIGAFEVANLASADPKALGDWLNQHNFTLKPATADRLATYTAEGWQFVAVRLASANTGDLNGTLDPIQISFPTKDAVYPMRLSAGATTEQHVEVALLAPHRMTISRAPVAYQVAPSAFGDWIDPSKAGPALANLTAGRMFLTVFDDDFTMPSQITQDYAFTPAPSDWVQHPVVYKEVWLRVAGIPVFWIVVVALLVAAALLIRYARRNARRRQQQPPWSATPAPR